MSDILERLAHCIAGTVTREELDAITLEACAEITRLRLTDAEWEAIQWAAGQARLYPEFDPICGHADALRGLRERLGGER